MSSNAKRFHPSERPAPKAGRKQRPVRTQRRQKRTHVNKYAKGAPS
jgi:hypothetical protein